MKKLLIALSIVMLFVTGVLIGFFVVEKNSGVKVNLYNSLDGSITTITIKKGDSLGQELPEPKVDGYIFDGWFYGEDTQNKINKDSKFYQSVTLKSGWTKIIDLSSGKIPTSSVTNSYKFVYSGELQSDILQEILALNLTKVDFSDCNFYQNKITQDETKLLNCKNIYLPNSLKIIDELAFKNKNISYINFGSSVETIGSEAFYNAKLNTISLPESIVSVGDFAFAKNNLKSVYIGKNCSTLGKGVFIENNSLNEIKINNENLNLIIENNIIYNKDKTQLLLSYGEIDEVTLPTSLYKINDYAFYNNQNIKSINFNRMMEYDKIYTVGSYAFYNCNNLNNIIFNNTVNLQINSYAFKNCFGLMSINFSSGLNSIGDYCFENCKQIKQISFTSTTAPGIKNLNSIGNGIFKNCSMLQSIIIPSDVEQVGSYVFYNCKNIKQIEFKCDYVEAREYTFFGCNNLETLKLKTKLNKVNNHAFANCEKLKNIDLSSVTVLGEASFKNCKNLTTLTIENVDVIPEETFAGCTGLINISINAKQIKNNAFWDCENLITIDIGASVEQIADGIFSNNKNLKNIIVDSSNLYYSSQDNVLYNKSMSKILQYSYKKINNNFSIISSVTEILDTAFLYATNITSFSSNSDVFTTKNGAIYNGNLLVLYPVISSINLQNCVINKNAFIYNELITKITLDSSVTILSGGLNGLAKLNSLTILNVTKNNAFLGQMFGASNYIENDKFVPETLVSVEINGINALPIGMFYGLKKLEKIVLGKQIINIDDNTFTNCSNLTEIEMKGYIQSIGNSVISGCEKLVTLKIGYYASIKLSENAFIGYNKDMQVTVNCPSKLTLTDRNNYKSIFYIIESTRRWRFYFSN